MRSTGGQLRPPPAGRPGERPAPVSDLRASGHGISVDAPAPDVRRFAHNAMATVFEIAVVHADPQYAAQCAHECFREIDRLEGVLSRYLANSDITRINRAPVGRPVQVGLDTLACLRHCVDLHRATFGACDVTIGSLLDAVSGKKPPEYPGSAPTDAASPERILLDEPNHTVTRLVESVCIDLGGYGKGYAVDRVAEILVDWSVESALVHGGTSSVLALEAPPGARGWQVTLRDPGDREQVVGRFHLRHVAVSGSGLRKGAHIVDPRTGRPVSETFASWAVTPTAARGDALSTAFMIMSEDEIRAYRGDDPGTRGIVIRRNPADDGRAVLRFGDCRDLERP